MFAYDRFALKALHYSGAANLLSPWLRGSGVVFMLHHVLPGGGSGKGFAPNAGLEVTPEFLDEVIRLVKRRGYRLISLEQAADEISNGTREEAPFAVFTLDDGYQDNFTYAWPVFRSHSCPFTVFVSPDIADGKCELWWRALEQVIAVCDEFDIELDGRRFAGPTRTRDEKQDMFDEVYWPLRMAPEDQQRMWIRQICDAYGVDLYKICSDQAMSWNALRKLNKDPLCTIGAHTMGHHAMKKLSARQALEQAVQSRERIAQELGEVPQTFAYPYGDETSAGEREFEMIRDAGFKVAVTTRKGMIFPDHKEHLTALPRLSLNGAYQERELTDVLLTGTPFALFNKLQRVVTV